MELRPYQQKAITKLREAMMRGSKRIMLYSPTGSGKTEMGMAVIRGAMAKGKRVVFACNRITLIKQTSRRFHKAGIRHGVIQADNTTSAWEQVLVVSIHTLASRGFPEGTDLLVIDEAHGATSDMYKKLVFASKCPVVGLSATPFTKGLGKVHPELEGALFEEMVVAASIQELIDAGYLVDVDVYAPSTPNLKGVKITAGDYNEKQLGERVDQKELIGDIVEHWIKLAGGQKTVCFATNIAHSKHIVEQFTAKGIRADHIDCFTDDDERSRILFALEDGQLDVVSNVSVLAEGWDCPAVSCMILARPTRSLSRYIQMVGRVLRPAEGKTKALMLDHSGSCAHLGFPTDDLPLELDDGNKPKPSAKEEEERLERMPKPCPKCHFVSIKNPCPACGHERAMPNKVVQKAGELVKLRKASHHEKQMVYSQLETYRKQKGYANGWLSHKYKEYFGVWPKELRQQPMPITPEIKNWILSRQIAFAKAQESKVPA